MDLQVFIDFTTLLWYKWLLIIFKRGTFQKYSSIFLTYLRTCEVAQYTKGEPLAHVANFLI